MVCCYVDEAVIVGFESSVYATTERENEAIVCVEILNFLNGDWFNPF